MSKPRTFQTPAVIIKKTRLGEADVIFTMYTPHLGKIQGIAKSVRKTASRMAGHLELLTYSQVTLARGKTLDTVIGCQTINSFLPLKSDLGMISCGFYILELVSQLTPDDTPDPALFDLLVTSLERLSRGADHQLLLRYFELKLLRHSGYHPELSGCVVCRTPQPIGASSRFAIGAGGLICTNCANSINYHSCELSSNTVGLLRSIQSSEWQDISQIITADVSLLEAEKLLQNYFRFVLDREIRSIAWLSLIKHLIK